jgi:hypothetical protein
MRRLEDRSPSRLWLNGRGMMPPVTGRRLALKQARRPVHPTTTPSGQYSSTCSVTIILSIVWYPSPRFAPFSRSFWTGARSAL